MRPHRSKQYKGRTYLNINRRMLGVGVGVLLVFGCCCCWVLFFGGFLWGFFLGGGFGVLFFFFC